MILSLDPSQALPMGEIVTLNVAEQVVQHSTGFLWLMFTHGHFSMDHPIQYAVLQMPVDLAFRDEESGSAYYLVREVWEHETPDFKIDGRLWVIEELSNGDAWTTLQSVILHEVRALKARLDEE
jgi:hypothetical protein